MYSFKGFTQISRENVYFSLSLSDLFKYCSFQITSNVSITTSTSLSSNCLTDILIWLLYCPLKFTVSKTLYLFSQVLLFSYIPHIQWQCFHQTYSADTKTWFYHGCLSFICSLLPTHIVPFLPLNNNNAPFCLVLRQNLSLYCSTLHLNTTSSLTFLCCSSAKQSSLPKILINLIIWYHLLEKLRLSRGFHVSWYFVVVVVCLTLLRKPWLRVSIFFYVLKKQPSWWNIGCYLYTSVNDKVKEGSYSCVHLINEDAVKKE